MNKAKLFKLLDEAAHSHHAADLTAKCVAHFVKRAAKEDYSVTEHDTRRLRILTLNFH